MKKKYNKDIENIFSLLKIKELSFSKEEYKNIKDKIPSFILIIIDLNNDYFLFKRCSKYRLNKIINKELGAFKGCDFFIFEELIDFKHFKEKYKLKDDKTKIKYSEIKIFFEKDLLENNISNF